MYSIDKDDVLSSSNRQDELFARLLPEQVELGEKQSTTLDWLLKRTASKMRYLLCQNIECRGFCSLNMLI
jgi:hypothetical protein